MHMLTVDIGNSRIKWALFSGGLIKENGCLDYAADNIESQLDKARLPKSITSVVVSCVAGEKIKSQFKRWAGHNGFTSIEFAVTRDKQNGVVNSYQDPAKMGVDRWLAVLAAFDKGEALKDDLICVVDCGTAITIDVIGFSGKHLGGLIMPGYQTMIQSLVKNTENIKNENKVIFTPTQNSELASSTSDALVKGCSQIIVQGISGIISSYQKKTPAAIHCLVTGGDGEWVSPALTVDNVYDPFLVLKGLHLVSVNEMNNNEVL